MTETEAPSYPVQIFMAGDVADAQRACRAYCFEFGACVTVTPTKYVYSGGQEDGFIVGLINYPRFPKEPAQIEGIAENIAILLAVELHQRSYTIQSPTKTRWFTRQLPFEAAPSRSQLGTA